MLPVCGNQREVLPKKKKTSIPTPSALRSDVCGICTLDILRPRDCAVSACRHTFHRDCILDYIGDTEEAGAEAVAGAVGEITVRFRIVMLVDGTPA